MDPITQTELAGVGIVVTDLERARSFYDEVFGMQEVGSFRVDVLGLSELLLQAPGGGSLVVLMRYDDGRQHKEAGQKLIVYSSNPEDVAAAVERLGGAVLFGPTKLDAFDATVAFVQDPDGHSIEVVDRRAV